MSKYEPQDGDEVEVVLRGTVSGVSAAAAPWFMALAGDQSGISWVRRHHVVSVTKVGPPYVRPDEPTGLGAVVLDGMGDRRVLAPLSGNLAWFGPTGWRSWGRVPDPIVVLSQGYGPEES